MWEYIEERVRKSAEYIIETGCTVRACSAHFAISKSTVHKDVSERLKDIDMGLYEKARAVSDRNLSERHIRGGIATKQKYLHIPKSDGGKYAEESDEEEAENEVAFTCEKNARTE